MNAKIKQKDLIHVNENNYEDEITVADVPVGYFPAVTANVFDAPAGQRKITVTLLELATSGGGTMKTNSGLYVRQENEKTVEAILLMDGKELDTNSVSYD